MVAELYRHQDPNAESEHNQTSTLHLNASSVTDVVEEHGLL